MSLDPDMHFGRPSSTAVRRLDLPRLVSTHHQYPRTPSPLPAPLQHNCASHYPANELTAHENIFRIYHRTLQPPATAQSRFTLQLRRCTIQTDRQCDRHACSTHDHQEYAPSRYRNTPNTKNHGILVVTCHRANHHRKESNRGDKTK